MSIYIRKELYPVEYILSKALPTNTRDKDSKVDFDGDLINMNSMRYNIFKEKGIKCVSCGVEGEYFAKEKHSKSNVETYHFNLYGMDENGEEVLMVKDKIDYKGIKHVSNYQTMCHKCSCLKDEQLLKG